MISPAALHDENDQPLPNGWFLLLVAAVLAIHVAGRVAAYCSPLQHDSYIYASFGYRIAHGEVMYRDFSDIKPPGLFWILALPYLVLPAGRWTVVPIESVFLLGTYYLVYRWACLWFNRAIAAATTLFAVLAINFFTTTGHVIEGFGLAENFMLLPAAACAWQYGRFLKTGSRWSLTLAGVLIAVELVIKQSALPLLAAMLVHWSAYTLRDSVTWSERFRQLLSLTIGASVVAGSVAAVLAVQGTLSIAWTLLTHDAARMVGRGGALPEQRSEIAPLLPVFVVFAWGLLAAAERAVRGRLHWTSRNNPQIDEAVHRPSSPPDRRRSHAALTFILLWCAFEVLLLTQLPLRSAHYHTLSCLPFVLLAAFPIGAMLRALSGASPRLAPAGATVLIVLGAAVYWPIVDRIVPTAIARYRAYDWRADQALFERAIAWGPIHFGRGKPWIGSIDKRDPSASPGRFPNADPPSPTSH